MTRTVYCDFCHAELTDRAWDCPARTFGYDAPRTSLDPNAHEIVDGSIGSWLACAHCVGLIRNGRRTTLSGRALVATARGLGIPPSTIPATVRDDLRRLHDQFWENREGEPVEIGPEQIALIASDPAALRDQGA